MNVPTISVTKFQALEKLDDYRYLSERQKTREDERLVALYKAVSKGARVIDIAKAFSFSGVNEKGQPKLAIARADWRVVWFSPGKVLNDPSGSWYHYREVKGGGSFSDKSRLDRTAYEKTICLPAQTFPDQLEIKNNLCSRVPHIPPKCRPKIHLRNFHILFEAHWETYPVDPFLMRRIEGNLFVTLDEWDLTPVEAAILAAMPE